MGAWIETHSHRKGTDDMMSLPSWERGLKRITAETWQKVLHVAPFMGAWIETFFMTKIKS